MFYVEFSYSRELSCFEQRFWKLLFVKRKNNDIFLQKFYFKEISLKYNKFLENSLHDIFLKTC